VEISVAAVTSIDGRLTRHDEADIYQWVSDEDQAHFRELIAKRDVLVMGSHTYEAIRQHMKLTDKTLRIVLTSTPEKFQSEEVPGKLEFVEQDAKGLVENLKKRGKEKLLIVGGTQIITEFLEAKLVNYVYLTLEPYIFGQGKELVSGLLDVKLQLESYHQLNDRGTLMVKYQVL